MGSAQQGHRLLLQLGLYGRLSGLKRAHSQPGHLFRSGSFSCSGTGSQLWATSRGLVTHRQKSPCRRLKALLTDYKKLSKFKLSALVALTASAGFAAGSDDSIDYAKLAWTSLGTFGAAACANTLNQLYEISNDARMARTCNRPLPAGRISSRHAAAFALLSGAAGLWLLHDQVRTGVMLTETEQRAKAGSQGSDVTSVVQDHASQQRSTCSAGCHRSLQLQTSHHPVQGNEHSFIRF